MFRLLSEKIKNYSMKTRYLSILLLTLSLISFSSFSQTENEEPLLGLPGDNLDLYAVLDLFQKSKTIEDFEKSLNEEATGINNIDLDNDGNIDFIKVVTEKDGDNFLFILQDPISETETQDVAVISVSKDTAGKVSMQIIGDETLYGKDYVVEPISEPTASVTANPAYVGDDPVTVNVAAKTEVIVVESAPVVQYVYSPVYVPYASPYYYGYHPYWWRPVAVIGIGIYRHNHWHHHGYYHGGRYGHTSVNININNRNTYNNYNRNKRNTSNRVNNNINKGDFATAGKGGTRPSTSQAGRGSGNTASNRASTRPSTSSGRTKSGASSSNRASASNKASTSNRASTSRSSKPSTSKATRTSSPSSSNRSSASRSSAPSRSSSMSRSRGGGGRRR